MMVMIKEKAKNIKAVWIRKHREDNVEYKVGQLGQLFNTSTQDNEKEKVKEKRENRNLDKMSSRKK